MTETRICAPASYPLDQAYFSKIYNTTAGSSLTLEGCWFDSALWPSCIKKNNCWQLYIKEYKSDCWLCNQAT